MIINGRGFILFRGFPVDEWGIEKSATAYMGLGTYFGNLVSQNGKGHLLGHVKDLGEDSSKIDEVRIYRTNARCVIIFLFFESNISGGLRFFLYFVQYKKNLAHFLDFPLPPF